MTAKRILVRGLACSHSFTMGSPLCISSILTAQQSCLVGHWKLLFPFRHCSASLFCITFITHYLPWLMLFDVHTGRWEPQLPQKAKPWRVAFHSHKAEGLPLFLHTHACAHTCTQFPCTKPLVQLKAIWSSSPQAWPQGFPRELANPPARSLAMQLPSTPRPAAPEMPCSIFHSSKAS